MLPLSKASSVTQTTVADIMSSYCWEGGDESEKEREVREVREVRERKSEREYLSAHWCAERTQEKRWTGMARAGQCMMTS